MPENESNENKKKVDIVKYDNDFDLSTNFNRLNKVQQDIFFTGVSYLVRDKKTHVVIPSDEIKIRAHLKSSNYSKEEYFKLIHGIENVVLHTTFKVRDNGKEWRGVLFDTFALDEDTGNFEMWLNPHAAHYFFDIPGPFSWYELEVFLRLHSRFEQILFRGFLAHVGGYWKLKINDLIDRFKLKSEDPKKTKQNVANFISRLKSTYLKHVNDTGYFASVDPPEIIKKKAKGAPTEAVIFRFSFPDERENLQDLRKSKIPHYANDKKVYVIKVHENRDFETTGKGDITVIRKQKSDKIRKLCPVCKAPLRCSISKSGREYYYCENSKKWNLGNKTCTFFRWRTADDKDDILE